MTTENRTDDQNSLLKELTSADPVKVIVALEELRISGKVSDIPVLIDWLFLTDNPEIKSKIAGLLSNLKEKDAVPIVIEAIQNQKYAPILKELISSCWENGLDFSKYLSLFVDLLIKSDLVIAFEAYSVIMNNEHRIDQEKIDQEIDKLEKALPITTELKRQLILDVIDFLPSIGY